MLKLKKMVMLGLLIALFSCQQYEVVESSLYIKFGAFDDTKTTLDEQKAIADFKYENLKLEKRVTLSGYNLVEAAIKKDPKLAAKTSLGKYGPMVEGFYHGGDVAKWTKEPFATEKENEFGKINIIANTDTHYVGISWAYYVSDDDGKFISSTVGLGSRSLKNGSCDMWTFDSYSFPK